MSDDDDEIEKPRRRNPLEKNAVREWISEHTEEEVQKEIDDMKFVSFHYEKYGEMLFCFISDNNWNIPIADFNKKFSDDLWVGCQEIKPFTEYLAKRVEYALNYFKGVNNAEIKRRLDEQG